MKGDFVRVKVRGEPEIMVQAMTDGADVDYYMPQRNETFIKVEVTNKAGKVIRTALFTASEVVSLITGHEMIARKKKAR